MSSWVIALICAAFQAPLPTPAGGAEQWLYIGLRADVMLPRAGLDVLRKTLSDRGMAYAVESSRAPVRIHEINVSVHPTVDRARAFLEAEALLISVGPIPCDRPIGDERLLWSSRPEVGGTLMARWKNIVVSFSWSGALEAGLQLAGALDAIIRQDRQITPTGRFSESPEIVAGNLPATVVQDAELAVSPEVRGLGDRTKVRFAAGVDHQWFTVYNERPAEGQLRLRIPPREGALRLEIVAANDENVFVRKTVDVIVVPALESQQGAQPEEPK